MLHRKIRYSLAQSKDCMDQDGRKITAFVIRTTDGEDETYAGKRADAKGTGVTEELIRFSLVRYEIETEPGKSETIEIKHPFEAFDKWSSKARNFVVGAWKKLATPDDQELHDFFDGATDVE